MVDMHETEGATSNVDKLLVMCSEKCSNVIHVGI